MTDVADPETLLRIIQSVPSPKAEPIKLWLAKVGYERIQDMSDPARSLDRARQYWPGYPVTNVWYFTQYYQAFQSRLAILHPVGGESSASSNARPLEDGVHT